MKPEIKYFLVNKKLLQSDRWLTEPFTRGQAWVDMFGLANYADGFIRVRGVRIDVKRGQLSYSQEKLSSRWKWSRGKVKRFLNELETDGDIVQQKNSPSSLITIVNYNKWQGDGTPNGTPNGTLDGHKTDTRRTSDDTHKKKKEEEREEGEEKKKEYPGKFFQIFSQEFPKQEAMKKAQKVWEVKGLEREDIATKIIDFVKLAKESKRWREGFIKRADNFLSEECWKDSVSEYNGEPQKRRDPMDIFTKRDEKKEKEVLEMFAKNAKKYKTV